MNDKNVTNQEVELELPGDGFADPPDGAAYSTDRLMETLEGLSGDFLASNGTFKTVWNGKCGCPG